MDAILLAAGLGTRMAPLTPGIAKPLLPVAGRTLLARMLDGLAAARVSRTVVVVHHRAAEVRAAATAWTGAMKVECVDQGEPRGTGHAVAAGAARVKGDALVVVSDAIVDPATLKGLSAASGFVVAAARAEDPSRFGALEVRGDRVVRLAEKSPQPPSDLVNAGLYRVPAAALADSARLKPSPRGELEFTDVVGAWAAGGEVRWTAAKGWLDLGAPWDLLSAQEALLAPELDRLLGASAQGGPGAIEPGVQVRGRLWVAAGATVRSGTYVEGDTLIGPGSNVGPNAYLRGPVVLGAGCRVGAAVEVKASLLLDEAQVPHLSYVGDSVLGPRTNLGAGTKVANLKLTPGNVVVVGALGRRLDTGRRKFGVCLGPDAKTGINCSLQPGTLVGAGALVGAGQVVSGWVPPESRLLGARAPPASSAERPPGPAALAGRDR